MTKKKDKDIDEAKVGERLTEKQDVFVREYLIDYNGTKAYMRAYPDSSYDSASVSSHHLLRNPKIEARIAELKADLEKLAGISRFKVLDEFMKLAFATFANLNKDWLTQKEFDQLTENEKACIAEIKSETIVGDGWSKDVLKIKLHDKQRALENINKMMGYNDQSEINRPVTVSINIVEPKN